MIWLILWFLGNLVTYCIAYVYNEKGGKYPFEEGRFCLLWFLIGNGLFIIWVTIFIFKYLSVITFRNPLNSFLDRYKK